jgi:hypothetical protein
MFPGNPTTPTTWQILAGFKAATKLKPSQRHEHSITVSKGEPESKPLESNDDTVIRATQELPADPLDEPNYLVRVENQNHGYLSRDGKVQIFNHRMQESLSQRQQGLVAYPKHYEVFH